MTDVYLKVHFLEKDEVKSLGARWDQNKKKWYVPNGLDLTKFTKWLIEPLTDPLTLSNNLNETEPLHSINSLFIEPQENNKGITLSQLLQKVNQAIKNITPELEWIKAEVSEVALHQATGHCYLELVETKDGKLLSKAKAMILKHDYPKLNQKFQQITGDFLKPGMQILVLVKLNFSIQYGLSLYIKDLDPTYTIGDLAAKLAEIRRTLQQEGIYKKNKQLPIPYDFTKIAVLSPNAAAGLGDFKREAALLQQYGLCDFHYYSAQFQGKEATSEINNAFQQIFIDHQIENFEVIVVIRGGGALIDLAWLNDYAIAKLICDSPIIVFSGIGHERDNTIIDEVAGCRFDTPSKVIAHIFNTIIRNAQQAKIHAKEIRSIVYNLYLNNCNQNIAKFNEIIKLSELKLLEATQKTSQQYNTILNNLDNSIKLTKNLIKEYYSKIHQHANINVNHLQGKTLEYYSNIKFIVPKLYTNLTQELPEFWLKIINYIENNYNFNYLSIENLIKDIYHQISKVQQQKLAESRELISNIISLGPIATLARGYTIIRDPVNKVLTSKQQTKDYQDLKIEFYDGILKVKKTGE